MKHQLKQLNRAMDSFLPKDRQTWTLMELYQSRALVRACIFGSIVNPLMLFFATPDYSIWQQLLLSFGLGLAPLCIAFCYLLTAHLKFCGVAYLILCSMVLAWAQLSSHTLYAIYWLWYPFLIVFCTLILGVKEGAVLTILSIGLFCYIFFDNLPYGNVLGTFANKENLLGSYVLQVVLIQICFAALMLAYDTIRNRTEVHAIMLGFTNDETDRLAVIGEKIDEMALQLNEELSHFHGQVLHLDVLAKRSDTKVEDLQKIAAVLQEKVRTLGAISKYLTEQPRDTLPEVDAGEYSPSDRSA